MGAQHLGDKETYNYNTLSLMGSEITLDRKGQKLLQNRDSHASQVWGIFCLVRGLANTPL